jgi:hypothetical protein
MPYTKDFTFDDIEEGSVIRDTVDHEVQKVGKYIEAKGWQVIPESINTESHWVDFYVPDDRWPRRYELLIED